MSPCSAPPPDPHNDQQSLTTNRFSIRKRIDMYDRLSATAIISSKERFQRAKSTLSEQLQLRIPEQKIIKLYKVENKARCIMDAEELALKAYYGLIELTGMR
uniref:Bm8077 n=1 Tax=Brugia malayi TaxID=6279 RepID=A0A1I9G8M8_BRUMA|nr:Bm8077 [Brugia malayi]